MNFIIWLIVGGIIGWVASLIMKRDAQQGIILNIVVGIVGSFLGGWLIAPLLGTGTVNSGDFSIMGLVSSLIGAVVLLLIINLFTRGRAR
ncbi:GlsB/YeaQ/YmgE family stress response membrane protein [Luteimonas panaciterrae]|uniref:GlsB/YeaQ/YmgE family stress response membrane protein n=1 Tax=Luteimonas panaciterrae TaxID=363885 RepID=UPI001CFA4016|nr:GlsB/YeaQ/YmgE family stress response membrane protein [Luteimonas panaciterrae]